LSVPSPDPQSLPLNPRNSHLAQVATPRVRTAVKADIPHVDDHVSKLHSVGAQTQQKLQDVSAACEAAGVYGVKLPHNCVSKGSQTRRTMKLAALASACMHAS
jgi:hypothetical protein